MIYKGKKISITLIICAISLLCFALLLTPLKKAIIACSLSFLLPDYALEIFVHQAAVVDYVKLLGASNDVITYKLDDIAQNLNSQRLSILERRVWH